MSLGLSPAQADARPNPRAARALVIAAIAVTLCGSGAPSPLYSLYQDRWHFDASVLTAIYAAYCAGTLLALCLLGRISDLLGDRRLLLCTGLVAVLIGAVVMAVAQSVPMLLVGRILAGIGTGAAVGPATAALLELDPARDGTRAAVVATVAMTAGGVIGPVVSGIAIQTGAAPTVTPFVLLAVAALVVLIGLRLAPWASAQATPVARRDRVSPKLGALIRAAGAPFFVACAGLALTFMVAGTFLGLGPSFARRLVGISNPALAGLTVAVFQVVGGSAQLACRKRPPLKVLLVGVVMLPCGVVIATFAAAIGSAILFGLGTLCTGLGYGACFSGAAALGSRSAPANGRATIVSLTYVAGYTGNLLPVLGIGLLATWFGLFTAMASLAAVATIAGAALAIPIWRLSRA
jgi:MFS family permease